MIYFKTCPIKKHAVAEVSDIYVTIRPLIFLDFLRFFMALSRLRRSRCRGYDSSGRYDSSEISEVDRLILGRFGAGSGVLLHGTSGSLMISLLLLGFVDIFVEIMHQ